MAVDSAFSWEMRAVYERARRAAEAEGPHVVFEGIDTSEVGVLEAWGISDGLYIDGKKVRTGPPPSYASLQKRMSRRRAQLQEVACDRRSPSG